MAQQLLVRGDGLAMAAGRAITPTAPQPVPMVQPRSVKATPAIRAGLTVMAME